MLKKTKQWYRNQIENLVYEVYLEELYSGVLK